MATLTTTISYGEPTGSMISTLGTPGPQGIQGIQGVQGIQGIQGDPGIGVPPGGATGTVLKKLSSADYDSGWSTDTNTGVWGLISGTLSAQTDLQGALDGKYSTTNPDGYVDGPYVSAALVGYASQAWVIGQNYLTASSLSGYATQAWVNSALTPYATQTYVNSQGFITSSALTPYLLSTTAASTYSPKANPTFTGTVTIPAGASISGYLTTTTAASTYLTIASASSTYAPKAAPTFTGNVNIPTVATLNNSTLAASTAYVKAQGYLTTTLAASTYQTQAAMSDYLTLAGNLSGLASVSTSRSNLGLGSIATASSSDYAITSRGLPAGGTSGQVLIKNSGSDYDTLWFSYIPGDRYLTYSNTSNTVSNGAKTFTVGTGLSYTPTQDLTIAYDAAHHMHGTVTTYNISTGVLVVNITNHTGTGTYASWTVNVGGTVPVMSVSWGDILGTIGDQSDLASALSGKLEVSTAASTYYPLSGNPSSFLTPSDLAPYLTISDAASTYASIGYVSSTYFPIAGGAITAGGHITVNDYGIDSDSEMAGFGFGVQKSSDHTKGTTVEFDGLDTYDGASHMQVNPTGLVFPDATTQTTSATNLGYISQGTADGLYYSISNPSGFTSNYFDATAAINAVSNSYASSVSNNPSSGNYLKYNGMTLEWDTPGGGGGGVAWGAITGTLSDQTDLQGVLDSKYSTSNPSGFTNFSGYDAISAITGGGTSSISGGATSNGQVLTYNGSQIYWNAGASAPGYTNSVWAYGNWYSANVTGIYDGYMNYYTVLTF
jgi:hypothetical protein